MNNNTVELIKIGGLALGSILLGYITKKLYDRKSTKSSDHFFVGIDLGATNAKAGVVNDKGELLATASHPLTDYTDKGVVKALVEVASEAVKEAGLEWKQITEIGVGSPGTIDFDNGVVIKASNFPTWDHVPLADLIKKETGVKTILDNDANAACAAECWVGEGNGTENMVMITLGSGIGGGVVVNGRIIHGNSGWAGEPGHSIYKINGTPCGCGQKGCFEKYASANGLVLQTKLYLESHPDEPSVLREAYEKDELKAKTIMDAAKQGDKIAEYCVDIAAEALGVCCVNICRLVDPELIVFSGGLALAGDYLLDKITSQFKKYHWTIQEPTCRLVISESGEKAGMIGAAAVARMDFMKYICLFKRKQDGNTQDLEHIWTN